MSTLYLTPLYPGSPQSPKPTTLAPSVAPQLKRPTFWRSRAKAFATSCGLWTASVKATSSWGRWIRRGLTTGAGTWSLREVWRPDWPDRQYWSTQGHKSRNECTRTLGRSGFRKTFTFYKHRLKNGFLSCCCVFWSSRSTSLPQYLLYLFQLQNHKCSPGVRLQLPSELIFKKWNINYIS